MPLPVFRNPPSVHSTGGRYSHIAEVSGAARWVHLAGQVGKRPDETIPTTTGEQVEAAFANILALLAELGMGKANIVKMVTYLVDAADIPAYREARLKMMGSDNAPATTLLVIAGLATPEYKVEIEVIACE
ncbi:RidA family protein [Elioraea sp.]|uniref:RidA family protein n=1 Tax=Elioraea sp. TaxID=2185103 RepID=UPI0025C37A07|nr:RidA family protein [Elioraea sp.]